MSYYDLEMNQNKFGRCRQCARIENEALRREDISHYHTMLTELFHSEDAFNDGARIAYIMQVSFIQISIYNHLVHLSFSVTYLTQN